MIVEYSILILGAFAAATVLPFYSEVYLIKLLLDHPEQWFWLALAASIGNTAGACINWLIGRYFLHYQDRRWFPVNKKQLAKGQEWFQKWGLWSLLFSWLPFGGDALTLFAGIMRVRFLVFVVLTFIGKSVRYYALVLMGNNFL